MGAIYQRKYGEATTVDFCLYELDGTDLQSAAAHAAGDTKIMKDEAAEGNTANAFVDEGQGYSLALSVAEMEAARVVIYIVDQTAPKAWLDRVLVIETYGHASAQHAFDLDTATVNLSAASEAQIDAIETDTNELQTDWHDGGRLDLLIDSIITSAALSAAYSIVNSGLGFRGTVTNVPGANQFKIATLAGVGAGTFVDATSPWYAYVFRDAGGLAGAPQGEYRLVTAYNTADGQFTTAAFTAAVAVGDDVIITRNAIANITDILADTNDLQSDLGVVHTNIVNMAVNVTDLMADVGDASASTLGSLYGILGDPAADTITVTVEALSGTLSLVAIADAVWDEVADTNNPANADTCRKVLNIVSAALVGKSSGGGTAFPKFRDLGDTKNRVEGTVDADGNRTALTNLDGT